MVAGRGRDRRPGEPTGPLDPRTPILVGVGTASSDAEAVELMALACQAALGDAGGRGLGAAVDRVAVPQGSWAYPDPARLVARRIGAPEATTHLVELGIPQQSLINDALAAIVSGASDVAVVVGGEAKRWARDRERAGLSPAETAQPGATPDVLRPRPGPLLEPVEVAHRLWDPVQQYAMIDNALRAAEGRTIVEHRAEIAGLWDRMNAVAGTNPEAAFPDRMDAGQIATATPDNRPLAFPYNKWHSTQWTVNQAAALVMCSVEAARRLGVPSDRWVFPLVGLESSHAVSVLCRGQIHAWPAMEVLGGTAAARLGPAGGRHRGGGALQLLPGGRPGPAARRSACRSTGLPPSPGAWPSPADRSTTPCCSRWPQWCPDCATSPDTWVRSPR